MTSNSPKSHALAAERYRLLIAQIREEEGDRHGWKSAAARRLGCHPSLVSRIAAGKHSNIGPRAIEAAIRSARIDPQFFYDDRLEAPHFSAFLLSDVAERGWPEWQDARDAAFGSSYNRLRDYSLASVRLGTSEVGPEALAEHGRSLATAVLESPLVLSAITVLSNSHGSERLKARALRELAKLMADIDAAASGIPEDDLIRAGKAGQVAPLKALAEIQGAAIASLIGKRTGTREDD